ncbi:MAG TPA: histidine kinase [Trebonia sp.]|jgi:signal transduction histidine kinase|nr:histidine kinase [Trebonia sp.]
MGERWLTSLTGSPRAVRVAGALLALAAFGQAIGQAVSLGFANSGKVGNPEKLGFFYAVALSVLALLSTLPLLVPRPAAAAVVTVLANVLVLAVFPAPTVAGALGAVFAAGRLGADGELRPVIGGRAVSPAAAQYLAVGLGLPFLVLALVRHENLACVLLAAGVPMAAGAGIARRAGRAARTYSEAGEALADTLVAHTARGERARIARELHDVVAHHISMIAVQAETGRLTVPGLPEAGARRFLEIGDTARAGLTEMRRLLGVLREDAAGAADVAGAAGAAESGTGTRAPGSTGAGVSRQPQPGLAQLAELIDAAREASVAGTRLIISGPVAPLDPGVELAAYRIVQEALTNARRHAAGAAVDVELRYGAATLRLRVRDNGPGPVGGVAAGFAARQDDPGGGVTPPAGDGVRRDGGHGLLGMRERAFSVGGALYAGAAPGGGFLVEAVLPAEPDPVRRPRASVEAGR